MSRSVDPDLQARLRRLSTPPSPAEYDDGARLPVDGQEWGYDDSGDNLEIDELPRGRVPIAEDRPKTPRRGSGVLRGLFSDHLAGFTQHLNLDRMHLLVMALLALVAVAATTWYILGTSGGDLTTALAAPVASQPGANTPATSPNPATDSSPVTPTATPSPDKGGQIVVHVLGAVAKPGLVRLPEGARVADGIAAAGGMTAAARPGELNLAQRLQDGQQILIGNKTKPGGEVRTDPGVTGPSSAAEAPSATGAGGKVNLNTATETQLTTLPGVGPVTAKKIIAWREASGPFTSVGQLQEVDGIGPRTMERLTNLVTI